MLYPRTAPEGPDEPGAPMLQPLAGVNRAIAAANSRRL
jgi:hypothetical protein